MSNFTAFLCDVWGPKFPRCQTAELGIAAPEIIKRQKF